MAQMTRNEILKHYKDNSPKDLIALFEGLRDKLYNYVDIADNPTAMFKNDIFEVAKSSVIEACQGLVESIDYGNETQLMESFDDNDTVGTVLPMTQVHMNNLSNILENSAVEVRRNANQLNLNQLTPFDAFLPFTIIRSYLPLIGKDLMPTQTPPQPFVRIKEMYKYVVTKDNKKYLRPDIYNDSETSRKILDSAKGGRITDKWYPEATKDETGSNPDAVEINGEKLILESYVSTVDGTTVNYYFQNDVLVRRDNVFSDGHVDSTYFATITTDVADSYFEIPKGYGYINLSFLEAFA